MDLFSKNQIFWVVTIKMITDEIYVYIVYDYILEDYEISVGEE